MTFSTIIAKAVRGLVSLAFSCIVLRSSPMRWHHCHLYSTVEETERLDCCSRSWSKSMLHPEFPSKPRDSRAKPWGQSYVTQAVTLLIAHHSYYTRHTGPTATPSTCILLHFSLAYESSFTAPWKMNKDRQSTSSGAASTKDCCGFTDKYPSSVSDGVTLAAKEVQVWLLG